MVNFIENLYIKDDKYFLYILNNLAYYNYDIYQLKYYHYLIIL